MIGLMISISGQAQLFDTTGLSSNWPVLSNSYETWMVGAFNAGRDTSNPADFGWGAYNQATHIIGGDSIYIVKTVQGNYKGISIDQLASGVFTITYSDLDGSNKTTKLLDRSTYTTKNFFYYSLDAEMIKDLEPWTDDWDILFTKYPIFFPGFGSYAVSGVLHNRNVMVSQVEKDSGVAASINDTVQFPFSGDISTIGYDWKSAGPSGTVIFDTLTYYVRDQMGNINELKLTDYTGSGTGKITFMVNGQADSIALGAGNVDQVYYSTESKAEVQVNQDKDWDLAFYAQSGFSDIPVRINDANGVELYIYPKADITHWNTASISDQQINLLSVYPNPSSGSFNLAVQSDVSEELSIEIVNTKGQLVRSESRSIEPGVKQIKIDTEGLNAGVFVLNVKAGNYQATTRILVQP